MPQCDGPFFLNIQEAECGETPTCIKINCYTSVNCLVASTLSPIIAGCRREDREIYCYCPSEFTPHIMESSTKAVSSSGLSAGAIVGIVIACVVAVILILIIVYFAVRYVKDRRKNHGEYRPQFEEQHHAKDLPYLQPPNIEGLI